MRGSPCWSCARHDGAVLNCVRGPRNMAAKVRGTERAVLRRADTDRIADARAIQAGLGEALPAAVDAAAVHKVVAVGGRHRAQIVGVDEIEIPVVKHIHVADEGVVDIDDIDETVAATKPGEEWFAPAEREPAYAEADAKTEASAEPAYEGRTVNRVAKRSGAPTPPATDERPAAVVVRSKAPRLVADPSPAPRSDPIPVAVAIGRPVGANIIGIPDMAVFRLLAPFAVAVEVVVAGDVARDIVSRFGAIFSQVALFSPFVEPIGARGAQDAVSGILFGAAEFGLLAGVNFVRFSGGADFAFAAKHGDARRIPGLVDVNAKIAGLAHVEDDIWRVNFIDVALAQFANAEIDGTFGNAHLSHAFIEVEERKSGHAADMERGLSRLQFGTGIFVHPDFVANGHGAVLGGIAPIPFSAGLQRDGTFDDADAGDALGRIFGGVVVIGVRLRRSEKQKAGNAGQNPKLMEAGES